MSHNKEDTYFTEADRIGTRKSFEEQLKARFDSQNSQPKPKAFAALESLQDIADREEQREEDGFPRRVKFKRKLVGPGQVVVIPVVNEDQLTHGNHEPKYIVEMAKKIRVSAFDGADDDDDITVIPGSGDGDVGDVVGETPLPLGGIGSGEGEDGEPGDPSEPGDPGEDPADHQLEEEAYELGKKLAEEFELPNLTDKRKRFPTDEFTYDLTDINRGSGQFLDTKRTLREIVETNLVLGTVTEDDLDPSKMIVDPKDKMFRVLSRERIWKSQAVVCFLRDYSGSMWGDPTEALVAQHLMIYSWLLVEYDKRVIPRFFVHDTHCQEVTAREYFGLNAGGGTLILSGYQKINRVVEEESLESEYDIFVFQGSDGDDWASRSRETLAELENILGYVSRMGVTLFKRRFFREQEMDTTFEQYIHESGFLESRRDAFRMHVMGSSDITEEDNIEAIKALIATD
ncbi:MAG: DUF444 family protein [Candidatus Spechtbacterales bacterium]|nr:DUF444 family protein [Candidatus Spechtbacterales bacterium]